jgi:1-aminocyclopropane-1-carboxylate deaminase
VSGNKYRKLKYNLAEAKKQNHKQILTFGGAFSNHIAAVAFAGKDNGFKTIGVIRGEELANKIQENPTLLKAQEAGMKFLFVTREHFREKENQLFLDKLHAKYGDFYLIPEGGTNQLAVKGCEEILTAEDFAFDYICCAVGTGGTISGIINSAKLHQKVLGFPALKGDFLSNDIRKFAKNDRWELITDYSLGGYAKVTPEYISFLNSFYQNTNIPLDPVYTGKMVLGVMQLIEQNYFPEHSKILLIHTGGLQGIVGMNQLLKKRGCPQLVYGD